MAAKIVGVKPVAASQLLALKYKLIAAFAPLAVFLNMAWVNRGTTSPGSLYFAVVGTPAGTQLAGLPGGIWSTGTVVLTGVGFDVVDGGVVVGATEAVLVVGGGVAVSEVVGLVPLLPVHAARARAAVSTAALTAPRLDRMRENYRKDRFAGISLSWPVDNGRLSTGQIAT